MHAVFKKMWSGWKAFAHKVGRFQTLLLLTLFYFIVLAPLGGLFRLFGWDPVKTRPRRWSEDSNWTKVIQPEPDLESMRRQS